jgi:putative DNA primase/helicase
MSDEKIPDIISLTVNAEGLPSELKTKPYWVAWRNEWDKKAGKFAKLPRDPKTGKFLGQVDCRAEFDTVMAYYAKGYGHAHGVGYSLGESDNDRIVFVDLDRAVELKPVGNETYYEIEPWAQLILDRFPPGYREFSPSGTGIHLIVRGEIARAVKAVEDHKGFEIYSTNRYLALTGITLPDSIDAIPEAQEAIDALVAQVLPSNARGIDYQASSSSYVPTVLDSDRDYEWITGVMDAGHLDHAVDDYATWLDVGMGLHAKFGNAGIDLWDRWSTRSTKYHAGECHRKGAGFSASGPVTFASVIKMAMDGGASAPWGQKSRAAKPAQVTATKKKIKAVQEPSPEPVSGLPEKEYTDLKFADMTIDRYGDRFRFVESWKSWASYDVAGLWVMSNFRHHEFFKRFAVEPDDYLGSSGRIRAAASLAASDPKITIDPDQFDADPDFLNLKNGVYDLRGHRLIEHDPMFLMTRQAAVVYDPSARCPKFLETLESMQPDQEIRDFLQRWAGTLLTGRTTAEVTIHYGDGANGKTTILEALGLVLGTYFAKLPSGFVAKSKHERHPTELVTLYKARFALASESDMADSLDEAKIKTVTGDGEITARRMHENNWTFRPSHKMAIATNHLPAIQGRDSGIWRRVAVIPWDQVIPEAKRQPNYERVIYDQEASGILNWMIEGLKEYQRHGLAIPSKVVAASEEVRASSDWISEFFAECLTTRDRPGGFHSEMRIRASRVYELYATWAKSQGMSVLASNKTIPVFGKKVDTLKDCRSARMHRVQWFVGIREKEAADHDHEETEPFSEEWPESPPF